ncbi:hypothetical protein DPMN_027522 [Dreissena polymorpha]|uniref:Uncharacterized protein n=1 Tax=Dreissena polymorpha TaxID=45954 RepID=A0A9D4LT10_DREPO|nr:hypothetical protein DPMN_027522 [Dreissena polymorpha]
MALLRLFAGKKANNHSTTFRHVTWLFKGSEWRRATRYSTKHAPDFIYSEKTKKIF